MADVLHRTTKDLRRSVNTPDYDPVDWIINPDLSALASVPAKHWKIAGDVVSEMTSEEKEAVDLPLAKAEKLAAIDAWWAQQAADGINPGTGVYLKSDSLDATQLQSLLIQLTVAPDETPTLVSDVDGIPHIITAGQFRSLSTAYATEFSNRRTDWAAAKAAVITATTTAEVAAVEVPTHG